MKILGIDPGTKRIGYGLIKKKDNKVYFIESGLLNCQKFNLPEIESSFKKLLKKTKPNLVVVEKLFFMKNKKTAMAVAEVIGILKLVILKNKIKLLEVYPSEVKSSLTGNGQADKKSVMKMINIILKPKIKTKIDDIYDALAIALAGERKLHFNN